MAGMIENTQRGAMQQEQGMPMQNNGGPMQGDQMQSQGMPGNANGQQQEAVPQSGGGPVQALADAAVKQVPPKYQDAFQRVVLAGRKVMYGDDKTHAMFEKEVLGEGDPAQSIGSGVTKLMGMLMQESRNTIPKEVFVPASLALMAEALDYVGQKQGREIGNEDVDNATKSYADSMMQLSGYTPDMVEQMAGKTQEWMQDPRYAQLIQQRMGGANGA